MGFFDGILGQITRSGLQRNTAPQASGAALGGLETFNAPYGSTSFGYGGLQSGTAGLAGLTGKSNAGAYRPDVITRALITGPSAQNWANPADRSFQQMAGSLRAGEDVQRRNIRENAATANLGRSYAGQLEAQLGQQTQQAISSAYLQSLEVQAERQFGLQRMQAQSMLDRMTGVIEERRFRQGLDAMEEANEANMMSSIFGSVLGAAGAIIPVL